MIPRFHFSYTINDFVDEISTTKKKYTKVQEAVQTYFSGSQLLYVGKARIGIRIALQAMGLKAGSAVGVQPFTCSSVLSAIKRAGFRIVFIDIDSNLRLSLHDLRTKSNVIDALIVTHTFGFPDDIEAIKSILGGKPVIEDCAQAFLSEYKDKPVGLNGEAGIFSMGYGKLFGIGNGGFIVSNNDLIKVKLIKQAEYLQYPSKATVLLQILRSLVLGFLYRPMVYSVLTYPLKRIAGAGSASVKEYPLVETAMPHSGVSLIARKFAENQLKVQMQHANGVLLEKLIEERFQPIKPLEGSKPNYFVFPLQSENRDAIVAYLASNGIEAGKHFGNSVYWVQSFGYQQGDCPNFERIASTLFTLPCHYYLGVKQVDYMAKTLNKFHVA